MVRLEDEGRPQSDGSLAAASNVNPEHPQPRNDLVPPGPGVAVDGAECSATPGIPQILRIPRLSSQLRIVENRAITRLVVDRDKPRNLHFGLWCMVLGPLL